MKTNEKVRLAVEQRTQRRNWPLSKSSTPSIILQPRLLAVLAILALVVSFTIVIHTVRTLAVMTVADPSNPFPAFADVLPGETYDAVLARGFSCAPLYYYTSPPDYSFTICTLMPETGMFSVVKVTVTEDVVYESSFTLRDDTLKVGDLVRWWGRPAFRGNSHFAGFIWPRGRIYGRMITPTGEYSLHYSLLLSVSRIVFVSGTESLSSEDPA